jgi:tRNA(Ile)-lysidine synthase
VPKKARDVGPVSAEEAAALFADLVQHPALLLAVSGGPDSTALLLLAAAWRARLGRGPKLVTATVDHGLRPEGKAEAQAVKRLAARLGVPHRTLRWTGRKPRTGIQEAARAARYELLGQAARQIGARHILTAHTLDDQAETVLFRLARGSGITGLAAMSGSSPIPTGRNERAEHEVTLVRPLLGVPKVRLYATLESHGQSFAEDVSNHDPRFARPRLRQLMPLLATEGLDALRLAQIAERARRAEEALQWATQTCAAKIVSSRSGVGGLVAALSEFRQLPEEIALRLLGSAVAAHAAEGSPELGKLEVLTAELRALPPNRSRPWRRTLAGALVTASRGGITVQSAPPRRKTP